MVDLLDIKDPSFIKELSIKELKILAEDIRKFLIENISKTGGHLSSNLGVVEITLAMYYVFDPEKDKFLFDVGHQSYVHKILTGRAKDFATLRQFGGLSGYINKKESKYDVWESGHSSTTISAMAGMLIAEEEKQNKIISLIGDSSIVNGVALEGLNFLGSKKDLAPIIILNDNKMGITKSVGALSGALSKLRGTKVWLGIKRFFNFIFPNFINRFLHKVKRSIKAFVQQDNIFEDMGFDYHGPIKGNDIRACIKALKRIKNNNEPLILHILTEKGKGYKFSENDPAGNYHGVGPFDIETGKPVNNNVLNSHTYSEIVSEYLINKREKQQFYVVTPAMKSGAKLDKFANLYKKDFYDVGIAEEHAAVMSAGMALANKKVVLLYYSTFAQRAYDQILNDIARQDLGVIIGIDRAGVVGEDGETHQGLYDVSMFTGMPNIIVTMPKDAKELVGMFNYAFNINKPFVIRYPKSNEIVDLASLDYDYILDNSWDELIRGKDTCLISYGPDLIRLEKLIKDNNLEVGLVNARFIKPVDNDMLNELSNRYSKIVVIEQVVNNGSLYSLILDYYNKNNISINIDSMNFNVDTLLPHGKVEEVLNNYGLSDEEIINKIS